MACFIRKALYLVALVFLLSRLVDFNAPEFEPLHAQWQSSFGHISQHRFFGEYITPVQEKVSPVVTDLKESYIIPSFTRANSAALDKYQVYLSKHVETLQTKIAASPIQDAWDSIESKLTDITEVLSVYFTKAQQLATKYTAAGLIKSSLYFKYAYTQSVVFFHNLTDKSIGAYTEHKPKIVLYYNNTVVPKTSQVIVATRKLACDVWTKIRELAITTSHEIKTFYYAKAHPFLNEKVYSHVQLYYQVYAKKYVDLAYFHTLKYYHLFKVNQALAWSKAHATGAVDQVMYYLNNQKASVTETETEATTAVEEDIATPTETVFEAMGTPEAPVTDDDVVTEVIDEDQNGAVEVKRDDNDIVETEPSLAEEIAAWKSYILESVDNIFANFDTSISDIETTMIEDFRPTLTAKLQNLTISANKGYTVVNKAIYNINSTTARLENGQEVEIDRNGNIIDHKITRQEMRDLLANNTGALKDIADDINTSLRAFVSDVEVAIDEERKLIVDIYEEFAEVAINEFSKKMMYSTFSSSFKNFQEKKDDESFKDWREYVKIKNMLISKREDLIHKKAETTGISNLLATIRQTLSALDHETGNYYAVLRAQANLAFQEREKKEREEEEALESPGPESHTITSTIIKIQTLQGDGQIPIQPIVDEAISDDESSDEDFETPSDYEEEEPVAVVDSPAHQTVVMQGMDEEHAVPDTSDEEEEVVPDDVEEPADPSPEGTVEHISDEDSEEEDEAEVEGLEDPVEEETDAFEDVVEHIDDDSVEDDEAVLDEVVEEETPDAEQVLVDTPEMRFATEA
ncbi:Outer spore wall assembly protein SHE10 [Cyberlindnera fabianii]|uniref:Outer spore wall assembly protein SHE10 n=1 Tax=Cyberlindnera fabianii TaxID=36022 RepID=A0A1V2LG72_CYBFA|nr:Outer spore wall assembly protein SHE10 [Cyberlindnera fabianii]